MSAPGCRAPGRCPVPDIHRVDLRGLRLAHLEPDRPLRRAHLAQRSAAAFNVSGRGDTRFGPLDGVGHAYVGASRTVVLLETVFHDVYRARPRVVYAGTDLVGWALGQVHATRRLALIDLRNAALERLGLRRDQLITTAPAHYPCTRQWADHLRGRRIGGVATVGLLWNSRVAELAADDSLLLADLLEDQSSEVAVIYHAESAGPLTAIAGGFDTLATGQGRLLIDQIATLLDAEIH